jgi:hypothetical protein
MKPYVGTVLIAAMFAAVLAWSQAGAAHAQIPSRLYGSVTLNGVPAPIGTPVTIGTAGKICARTTVARLDVVGTSYPYVMDVPEGGSPQECKPGAVMTFMVGNAVAAQTYTMGEFPMFQRIDLTAPGNPNVPGMAPANPNVPGMTSTIMLTRGCTNVVSTFPNGTPAATVAAAISPPTALTMIMKFDPTVMSYLSFGPAAAALRQLTTVNRGDILRICTGAAATLTPPA